MKKNINEDNMKNKKRFTILGISIWRILAYFIIYSVLGYVVETIFGIISKGVWESRQSFLYGPFCAIYGVGAVIMIIFLQYFNKNNNTLFWGGFLIGSITEYSISFIGEKILNVIWWDYSNMPLNINGRICVFFSIFWGLLAIYLMSYINPKVDKCINWISKKISKKILKIFIIIVILFMFIDCLITGFALKMFYLRMVKENNIDIGQQEEIDKAYDDIYNKNKELSDIIYKYFGNRKIIRTFPNLKLLDNNQNIIYFDSLLKDIQPYYIKFQDGGLKERIVQNLNNK